MISANGITKSVGKNVVVLKGVDLEVGEGERIAIMGPSGSGKTTLLSILAGFTAWDSGELVIDGRKQDSSTRGRTQVRDILGIGWIPQAPIMLPGRSVLDNVLVACRMRGGRRSSGSVRGESRLLEAIDLLERVGLREAASRTVSVLSGGELQRMAIARAMFASRRCVLADEPTASLDEQNTRRVVDALTKVDRTRTLIVATHDERVARACDRVIVIQNGIAIAT